MTMTVLVNGEEERFDRSTVAELVERLDGGGRGVAVAVNRDIVPRSRWGDHDLHDGDRIEVLRAAQGG